MDINEEDESYGSSPLIPGFKFEIRFFYDESVDDIVAELNLEEDVTLDLNFANCLAKTLFQLNQGTYKEALINLVKQKFVAIGRADVAATIFDSWQKLTLIADNEPDVNAEEVFKNGPIIF